MRKKIASWAAGKWWDSIGPVGSRTTLKNRFYHMILSIAVYKKNVKAVLAEDKKTLIDFDIEDDPFWPRT